MDGPGFVPRVSYVPLDLSSLPLSILPPVSMHLQVRGAPCRNVIEGRKPRLGMSQCTYRCVVLPDEKRLAAASAREVSMHLHSKNSTR